MPIKGLCYTGPDLTCSGILSGDTLEDALQKLDTQVCSATGDYSSYQFNCLPDWLGSAITTEAQFVDAITAYACEITQNLESFTGVEFPAYQSEVESQFESITGPSLTCSSAGVTGADSLTTILTKYCTKLAALTTAINVSTIDFASCFTVVTPPTTVLQGFQTLIDQICEVKSIAEGSATLPVFNNTGTCLASPGSADTLAATIGKIITRLCLTEPFDIDSVEDWGCLDSQEDLQDTVQEIITTVSDNQKLLITGVSADFVLSATDAENDCAGLTLELATPIVNNDRLVASNVADTDPGTLIEKLTEGDNITLDDTTTPGQIIISATQNNLVVAGPTDEDPGYLVDKLDGSTSGGITITPTIDGLGEKVNLILTTDAAAIAESVLAAILANPALLTAFCSMVVSCVDGNCGSLEYTITNDSGDYKFASWNECGNPSLIVVGLTDGGSITICAVPGSVTAADCVIVEGDSCTPATTTTTSTTTTTTTEPV